MKTKYNKIWSGICLVLLVVFSPMFITSCDDKVNDWKVDPSHDRLFSPLVYDAMQVASTSVQIHYSQIVTATRYVFEFYKDSMLFLPEDFSHADTIYADTLTAYKDDSTPAKVEYATIFENLVGNTQYSVRMKGLDQNGKSSNYLGVAFLTPREQLFEKVTATPESLTFTWKPTDRVTHLTLSEYMEVFNEENNTSRWEYGEPVTYDLTEEDIASASKLIEGLKGGTNYKAIIYYNDDARGEYNAKTLGLGAGIVIRVPWESDTKVVDMDALMEKYEVKGTSNLTLEFEPGKTYNINAWTLPSVDNLLVTSTTTDQANRPILNLPRIILSSSMLSLTFQYVTIDAKDDNSAYFFQPGSMNISSTLFEGCLIRNIKRCLVRSGGGLNAENITVNNSILQRISWNGWGVFNLSSKDVVKRLEVTNSTLIDIGDQLMDIQDGIGEVVFTNNTLYQPEKTANPNGLGRIFRFRSYKKMPQSPASVTLSDVIVAGSNGGVVLGAGDANYDFFDYSKNCYMTSDVITGGARFELINLLEVTSDNLFIDPANGDFHFKSGTGISAGVKSSGDPRWH